MEQLIIKRIRFKAKPVVNTDMLTKVTSIDFCNYENYVNCLPFRKRSRLEKAMIVFGSHCNYAAAVLDTSLEKLLANKTWRSHWFPVMWKLACKHEGIVEPPSFEKVLGFMEVINKELYNNYKTNFVGLFNLIKKGKYNER